MSFEDHLVACADCQDEVRLASALRVSLAAATSPAAAAPASRSRRGRRFLLPGIGLALAAGIGALLVVKSSPSNELVRLGRVREAPLYLGVAVRGSTGRADSLVDSAMGAYQAAHYATAAAGLRVALVAGADSVSVEFFLGASLLMTGNATEAAAVFGRVAAAVTSPYADEAQLLRAKALLQAGRARDALRVLEGRTPSERGARLGIRALADSVKTAGRF